jgi:hypothetical protein
MNEERTLSEEIAQYSNEGIIQVALQVQNLTEKLSSLLNTIETDKQIANSLKKVCTYIVILFFCCCTERTINNFLILCKEVAKELKNTELAMLAIERLKTPMGSFSQNFQIPSKFVILGYKFPLSFSLNTVLIILIRYWWDLLDSFEQRMSQYKQTIETIEKYLASYNQQRVYSPQSILFFDKSSASVIFICHFNVEYLCSV